MLHPTLPLLLAGLFGANAAPPIRLQEVRVQPVVAGANLAPNPHFEEADANGAPAGWAWDRRNTDAAFAVDDGVAHSGRRSLRFTNATAFGAHVYGMLWRTEPIHLEAGKPYTLSVWARAIDPGIAWIGGGKDWQFRLRIPATEGRWQRCALTITPAQAEADFVLRICTESPTPGFWLDDVKLEAGSTPTPCLFPGAGLSLEPVQPEQAIEGDGAFEAAFDVVAPAAMRDVLLQASLGRSVGSVGSMGGQAPSYSPHSPYFPHSATPAAVLKQTLSLEKGAWRILVRGEAQGADDAPRTLSLSLKVGADTAAAGAALRFYSAAGAAGRLDALRARPPALRQSLDAVQAAGQDTAYPLVTLTVLENFVGYAGEDLRHEPAEIRRALAQIGEMEAMAGRLEKELAEARSGKRRLPGVPRWTGTQRPRVEGPSFVAPAALPGASPAPRPLFFVGYGHFGQVRAGIERFPAYGVNIVQIEFGPNSVFRREGETTDASVRDTLAILDRAARAGVAVNLLISPHYFPGWMLEKYPHLRKRREGFLHYCLHAPEGQELLRQFIAAIIPPLKAHPALHSICLSNEPVNVEEPCPAAEKEWRVWLRTRHGDVATLNARWHTEHKEFEAVPLPNPYDPAGPPRPSPQWLDYLRFNQEWFAGWHKGLADAVHAAAPNLPVHAKGMTWTFMNDGDVRYGADAELFAGFSDINGNDSCNWYSRRPGEFAQGWQANASAYDLQRSAKDAPVFNSENHLILDRDTGPIPPEHVRAALWQGAIHGQSATTLWVWERTFDPKSDFAGSIMHRPACAEAVGRVCHDLNRAAPAVTALQRLKPDVVILHSLSAKVWDGGRASDCAGKLYTALSFTGLKIGYVTERQLERGEAPAAPLLLIPNALHLSDAAFAGLKRYRGRVLLVGEGDLLTRSEYGTERTERVQGEAIPFQYGKTTWRDLWQAILPKLAQWRMRPAAQLSGADGKPAWGVAWLCADTPEGTVVNLCNYRPEPMPVRLARAGAPVRAADILSGEPAGPALTLQPLETRLLRVGR